jgi:uncharacterized protein (TIGR02588 family)
VSQDEKDRHAQDKDGGGESGEKKGDQNASRDKAAHPPTIWEWLTLVVSSVIILAVVGALIWHARTNARPTDANASPRAEVEIRPRDARRVGETWMIPLRVRNTGNVALELVQVRVTLTREDGKPDEREIDFVYLAEGAAEEAVVVSSTPPEQAKPKAEVLSFKLKRNARGY